MSAGINEAVVNIHHFADKIEDWAKGQDWVSVSDSASNFGVSRPDSEASDANADGKFVISFSDERAQLLETGGAVLHARRFLEGCGHFLIHNVDILSNADLQWLQSEVKPEALATLMVSERETTRFLLFEPETMRLVGWHNTDSGAHHLADDSIALEDCRALGFSGIHILSDKVLDLMEEYARSRNLPVEDPTGVKFSIMNFYLWAASKYPIYGVVAKDLNFLDVGKLDALAPAEEFVKKM